MDQRVIDRAVSIATNAAMNGSPVSGIEWVPPTNPTDDPVGMFIITLFVPASATERLPWT